MHITGTTLLLAFLALSAQSTALGATLTERISGLAVPGESELHYSESRSSGLLSKPVVYSGRLAFDPQQGTLTKWVDEPRRARLTLTDAGLEVQSGAGRVRRLPLERQPELAALLAGLRALLEGDPEALLAVFQADYLEGQDPDGGEAWVLQLKPVDQELAGRLVLLELRGSDNEITRIDSLMGSGERQSMTILPSRETVPSPADDQDDGA